MTRLINQRAANVSLLAGNQLSITGDAACVATVEGFVGENRWYISEVPASGQRTFGPFQEDFRFTITCLEGTLEYVQAPSHGLADRYLSTTVAVTDAVSETTATPVDVCTLDLPAGDWDVSGVVNRDLAGTTATRYTAAISAEAATIPAQAGGGGIAADSVVNQAAVFGAEITGGYVTVVGPVRVLLAAPATIHLVAADVFSAGTVGLFGTLRARLVN